MKKINLFLLSFLVFFILSCSNMFEHEAANNEAGNAKYLTVSGTLSAEFDSSAVPRSAFPANDIDFTSCITNFYYKKNKADPTGTFCGTSEGRDYVLKLPALGTYYIDAVTTSNDETSTYKTSEPVQITLTEAAPYFLNLKIGVYLVMDDSSTAKGSVRLPIQIFEVSKVQKMEVYENGQRIAGLQLSDASHPSGERLLDWTIGDLTKGVHEYTFKFYSDQACTNLVYQFTEKVTIFPGMETNTWVNNGNAEYIGRAEGKDAISITQACLDNFALTNFYVSSESGNDGNNGSYFAPLKTIQKALEKCADGTKEYTINLKGTFEPSAKLTVTKKIKIQKAEGAETAAIVRPVSGHTTSMISVDTGAVCTIKDIIIDGSSVGLTSVAGAGINNAGTVTLKNCIIRNCFTEFKGGAIFSNNGSLYIEDTVIGDALKTTVATSGNCSNKASQGAGIFFNQNNRVNKLKISGNTKIIGNYAAANGGGCYFYISNFDNIDVRDQFAISYCAANKGGGIYIDGGRFELKENTSISHCAATGNGGNGGGININEGKIIMSGGSITDCSADRGAGVYVNATFEMSGGNISGCTATTFGSGVYVDEAEDAVFNLSGSAYIASNNDVYLAKNKTIEITGDLTSETLPVAVVTIPSSNYGIGREVLTGTNILLLDNYYKIDVTPIGSVGGYIGSNGKLCRINNYRSGAKIIRHTANLEKGTDNGTSIYRVDGGKKVYIVSNLDLDRELRVNGEVYVPSGLNVKITFTQNTPRITTNTGCTIGEASGGGTLIIDGKKDFSNPVNYPLISIASEVLVNLKNVVLQNNYNTQSGGGVIVNGGSEVHMTNCTIKNCKTNGNGGGIYYPEGNSVNLYINGSVIKDNEAIGSGGGIYSSHAAPPCDFKFDFEDSPSTPTTISGNTCQDGNGGGIFFRCGTLYYYNNVGFRMSIDSNLANGGESQIYVKQSLNCYPTSNLSNPGNPIQLPKNYEKNITQWPVQ